MWNSRLKVTVFWDVRDTSISKEPVVSCFCPGGGCSRYLQNDGTFLPNYMVPPRKQQSLRLVRGWCGVAVLRAIQ
jgi:hypothetical protein